MHLRSICAIMTMVFLGINPVWSQTMRIASNVRVDSRSGRLIRTRTMTPAVVAPRVVNSHKPATSPVDRSEPDKPIKELVDSVARHHDVEPALVHSVVQVESSYNPFAVSYKGAEGLMQLVPETARRFGVRNSFNPADNLAGGVKYLKYLLELYGGDERLALAAYNAGEAAVSRWGGIPPYTETRNYVHEVGRRLGHQRRAARMETAKSQSARRDHPEIVKTVDAEGREFYTAR